VRAFVDLIKGASKAVGPEDTSQNREKTGPKSGLEIKFFMKKLIRLGRCCSL
jgi:hypothetical protein